MFVVNVKGRKEVVEVFDFLRNQSLNVRPVLVKFRQRIHNDVMRNFKTQSSSADISKYTPSDSRTAWKPLRNMTVDHKQALGFSQRILQMTGRMKSLMGDRGQVTKYTVSYGTSSKRSPVHQNGALITPKRATYLTIPFPGVKGRAPQYRNTFVRDKIIFQRTEGNSAKPLFLLKKSVRIPKRVHLTVTKSTIDAFGQDTINHLMKRWSI